MILPIFYCMKSLVTLILVSVPYLLMGQDDWPSPHIHTGTPHNYGYEVSDFPEHDRADSLARMEIQGHRLMPSLLIGQKPSWGDMELPLTPLYLEFTDDPSQFYLALTKPTETDFPYGEWFVFRDEIRFKAKGIRIQNASPFTPRTIYEDTVWEAGPSDTLFLPLQVDSILRGEENGVFSIRFLELIRVDSKGRAFKEPESYQQFFDFSLYRSTDPIRDKYGPPRPSLHFNEERHFQGDFVPNGKSARLTLDISPLLRKAYPGEDVFQIRGYSIVEVLHRGHRTVMESDEYSAWSPFPFIELSLDSLEVKERGHFYLSINQVARKSKEGKIYSYLGERFAPIEFYKKR